MLQQVEGSNRAKVRGHEATLVMNVTYKDEGKYVCVASNTIKGNEQRAQSEPVKVQVVGKFYSSFSSIFLWSLLF